MPQVRAAASATRDLREQPRFVASRVVVPRRSVRQQLWWIGWPGTAPFVWSGNWHHFAYELVLRPAEMKYEQLSVLLPCYTLEDLELRRQADEAEQLLSAWTALWHPVLIQRTGCIPGWLSAEQPMAEPGAHLIALPGCCEALLPEDWLAGAEAAGSRVVRAEQQRAATVEALLGALEGPAEAVDPELSADFFALGFCHLTVELLTRQLRYMSNLDESSFRQKLLAAAEEGLARGHQAAREHIQGAFDLLYEAREYFYPVESYLIDLTLVAPTTLGEPLRRELRSRSGLARNLLLTAEVLDQLAAAEPESLAALRHALEQGTVAVAGAEQREGPLPLLPPEAIAWRIARGLDAFRRRLDTRPAVFARRRFGLTPVLPAILRRMGFQGALHQALDEGRFPAGNQSRVRWEGFDGTTIDAVGRVALDVSRADAFLRLPEQLGNAMDLDQVATVVLAHWAGHASPWYEDLRRAAGYTAALGSFVTLPQYFEQTGFSGQRLRHEADQYRSPYLRQAVSQGVPDPISRWVRYYRRRAVIGQIKAIELLAACCGRAPRQQQSSPPELAVPEASGADGASGADAEQPRAGRALENSAGAADLRHDDGLLEPLIQATEDALEKTRPAGEDEQALDQRLADELAEAAARFTEGLAGSAGRSAARALGSLVINPTPFERRTRVQPAAVGEGLAARGAVRLVEATGERTEALVDVPPMGFAWIGPESNRELADGPAEPDAPARARKRGWLRGLGTRRTADEPPMAEENVLRNEFVEVSFDPVTGAIRAISDYKTRGPRLAQQLALRSPVAGAGEAGDACHYSIMAADRIEVVSAGPLVGELLCCGRLVDRQGGTVAGFRQTTRLCRGSRVVELIIELDVQRPPGANPWDNYYACRFAWSDATANLYRAVNLANRPTDTAQVEAPLVLDIRASKTRTTLLSAGLPYHRRFGLRKLDTLLVVAGESERRFRLGIGIDLPGPVGTGWQFLAPPPVVHSVGSPGTPAAWLFHIDARNVLAGPWQPVWDRAGLAGLRVGLLETEGRQTRVGLRLCRSPRWAQRTDPPDAPARPLSVEDDRVTLDLGPHAWADVEIGFRGTAPAVHGAEADETRAAEGGQTSGVQGGKPHPAEPQGAEPTAGEPAGAATSAQPPLAEDARPSDSNPGAQV